MPVKEELQMRFADAERIARKHMPGYEVINVRISTSKNIVVEMSGGISVVINKSLEVISPKKKAKKNHFTPPSLPLFYIGFEKDLEKAIKESYLGKVPDLDSCKTEISKDRRSASITPILNDSGRYRILPIVFHCPRGSEATVLRLTKEELNNFKIECRFTREAIIKAASSYLMEESAKIKVTKKEEEFLSSPEADEMLPKVLRERILHPLRVIENGSISGKYGTKVKFARTEPIINIQFGHYVVTYDVINDKFSSNSFATKKERAQMAAIAKHHAKFKEIKLYTADICQKHNYTRRVKYMGTSAEVIVLASHDYSKRLPLNKPFRAEFRKFIAEVKEKEIEYSEELRRFLEKNKIAGSIVAAGIAKIVMENKKYITQNTLPKILRGLTINFEDALTETEYNKKFKLIPAEEVNRIIRRMEDAKLIRSVRECSSKYDYVAIYKTDKTREFLDLSRSIRESFPKNPTEFEILAEVKKCNKKDIKLEKELEMIEHLVAHPACYCFDQGSCETFLKKLSEEAIEFMKVSMQLEDNGFRKKFLKTYITIVKDGKKEKT